jgi:multidrug resistance efflux pump
VKLKEKKLKTNVDIGGSAEVDLDADAKSKVKGRDIELKGPSIPIEAKFDQDFNIKMYHENV